MILQKHSAEDGEKRLPCGKSEGLDEPEAIYVATLELEKV